VENGKMSHSSYNTKVYPNYSNPTQGTECYNVSSNSGLLRLYKH